MDDLRNDLRNNVVELQFVKKNGETRVMRCTLQENYLPPLTGSSKSKNLDIIAVYDLDNENWRSFRLDSYLEHKVLAE